ncbi:hypothetical protein O6H91_03G088000 [Diphasiastrum complanatum]|uniref:Uncharacterized protein n=2 Tax=Diphasiastrum complanatum TaxID=34168 RepID=A0ACC2E905_DIPCM|nr:hypothetical protein O6H91_03G088000 [Diphasiastrum complanatum]KAJ7562898.1 hypothetical protein O6H91_03G088000 [Diphasiastrum complanatum]
MSQQQFYQTQMINPLGSGKYPGETAAQLPPSMPSDANDLEEIKVDHLDRGDEFEDQIFRRTSRSATKNLVAERKRRQEINEKLYMLRSLVPNVSKLDKASILGDATIYIQEMQKKIHGMEKAFESGEQSHFSHINANVQLATKTKEQEAHKASIVAHKSFSQLEMMDQNTVCKSSSYSQGQDRSSTALNSVQVFRLKEDIYQLLIVTNNQPKVLSNVVVALESHGLEIHQGTLNASIDNCLCHFTVKMEGWETMDVEQVEKLMQDELLNYGI